MCFHQSAIDAVSVSPSLILLISPGKALAYASARLTITRGQPKMARRLVEVCT
jgi:hypothetical protein